jgi:hypothetical protein
MVRVRLAAVALMAIGFLFVACDSDDGSTDTGMTNDVVADQGPGDTGADTTVVEKVTFRTEVLDNLSKEPKPGALVEVVDNDTGVLTGMSATADAEGFVEFELDKGKMYGFKVSMEDNKDTYQFNIPSEVPANPGYETVWILSQAGFTMAAALAGFAPDPTKSIIAGAIYWVNDAGEEEYVSCGTIATEPAGEYRYFSGTTGLPAPLEQVPATAANKGEGRYVAGNVPAGRTTLNAFNKSGSVEYGEVMLWTYADSVCISNVYVDRAAHATNPSPATCE